MIAPYQVFGVGFECFQHLTVYVVGLRSSFGEAVAMNESYAVIGATGYEDTGAAFVYDPMNGDPIIELRASDAQGFFDETKAAWGL